MNNAAYPDYFNDVFGPIMQPGSSSHTAGPCRLGYLANCLLKAPLGHIRIVLDPAGSFASTFGHMNEDVGMLAGAYGMLPDDERMFDIRKILSDEGIGYDFQFEPLGTAPHPNTVRFILTDIYSREYVLQGVSTGGGRIRTESVMGFEVEYCGTEYLYGSFDDYPDTGEAGIISKEVYTSKTGKKLYVVRTEEESGFDSLLILRKVNPVVLKKNRKEQLFDGFVSWIEITENSGSTLFDTALQYEINSSGWDANGILSYMEFIRSILERETGAVYEEAVTPLETPFSGYHYRKWDAYEKNGHMIIGDLESSVIKNVLGVQALTRGVKLVPGPMGTGGGFMYSVIKSVAEKKGYDTGLIIKGLFIAAAVGAIAYTRMDPTGEAVGCAGECGVCSAMAAAAVTFMEGGTCYQVESAASLSLQSAMGWACDPIPGGNNAPCFSRFMTAAVMSTVFADLALSKRDAVIPFDEVIDEVKRMGQDMRDDLKCTSKGGICRCPTAKKCKEEFAVWMKDIKSKGA